MLQGKITLCVSVDSTFYVVVAYVSVIWPKLALSPIPGNVVITAEVVCMCMIKIKSRKSIDWFSTDVGLGSVESEHC